MAKRAKRGIVEYRETKSTFSVYKCPHCKVEIMGAGISKNVTRFLCNECRNEIIVEHNAT